ncbi:hypothetical protein F2Q69_00009147 [Brassica cretica]|uniref:Uncharacterized protein n=1 Tax=Brassica cretica TaxID=69181 RepID=A0A8S9P8H0_BRACR|nr:hypothetical protein F2Q69_00009147 [Brassica cretica]
MADQEIPIDPSVARLQVDVDILRIGCDKLARASRDSTERFNSLEKPIINIGTESNSKIRALERQMILINKTGPVRQQDNYAGRARQDKPPLRPRQYHTDEELDRVRRDGICFKCKSKWYKGHPCSSPELQIMMVVNGLALEVLEESVKMANRLDFNDCFDNIQPKRFDA